MTDSLILAPADQMSGAEFFRMVFGHPPRDRAKEAEHLARINAHWDAAKAESELIRANRRPDETALDHLIRAYAPLAEHDRWRREQGWLREPEQRRNAA